MKLLEFLETANRKVVEWLFHPVFPLRIVEPFDEVENSLSVSPPSFDRGHDFVNIIFLALLKVLHFP